MSEPNAQEPTMEEILASIRRIISEDEAPADAAEAEPIAAAAPEPEPEPAMVEDDDDVLELTERAPEPEPAVVETHGDLDVYVAAEPAPALEPEMDLEPDPAPMPMPMRAMTEDEPLVSEPAAATAAFAFGKLAQRIAMPKDGRTLEDVVRELLNPLLAAWLDEHLPAIVQAKVDEEVERIARRRIG